MKALAKWQLDRDSVHGQKVEYVLQEADFPFLCWTGVATRQALNAGGGSTSHIPAELLRYSINCGRFATWHEIIVFELQFSDSEPWVATIRLPDESTEPDDIETSMLSEIATMKLLCATTEIPASDLRVTPRTHQQGKIADQLAEYYYQLSHLRFDRIGRLWPGRQLDREVTIIPAHKMGSFRTSLQYLYALRRCQTRAIKVGHSENEQWATAAWIFEQALPSMVVEDHVYGPFPPIHVDLHQNNIFFDKAFNITGIIDWSGAQTVPVERFLAIPELATVVNRREHADGSIPRQVHCGPSCPKIDNTRSVRAGGPTTGGGWREHDMTSSPTLISDLISTPLWKIVYRCTWLSLGAMSYSVHRTKS
ncbi:hypothetical protein GJ744_007084 [Endocarpon pusillum]|uniref:Aminoglycoside phosphotransferase domain-containing protein n=1 Tax=Endocarpon pusillum TaxID=364733 RepID=A0A8H7AS72_9EURO|nr:hypothetical protein GJ744_007084 [Endocarpon pusillum]